ncbi:ribonuclease Z [Candidatus Woesearchaeota archaeon]|nr:ribonuclease Z [Candidatus Woesearchaeota archaeon]
MKPTKERNQFSLFVSYKNKGILIDCGEGTQRQLKHAGIKLSKINKILITHWHGDHTLGLPGLLQSMSASDYNGTLEIYGPKQTKEKIGYMFKAFEFDNKLDLKVIEVKPGRIWEDEELFIEALPMKHSVPCNAYIIKEKDRWKINASRIRELGIPSSMVSNLQEGRSIKVKGKEIRPEQAATIRRGQSIGIILDTAMNENCYKVAQDADILVCEAVYTSELGEKAEQYLHLTAKDAALIASKSNVKRLVLAHFSTRYKNTHDLENDARTYFDNVISAEDFLKVQS